MDVCALAPGLGEWAGDWLVTQMAVSPIQCGCCAAQPSGRGGKSRDHLGSRLFAHPRLEEGRVTVGGPEEFCQRKDCSLVEKIGVGDTAVRKLTTWLEGLV